MKKYLSRLDKIENRNGEDYFVMRSAPINNIEKSLRPILFPAFDYAFIEETLYRIDVNDNECDNVIEICSWEDLKIYVLTCINGQIPDCASLILELTNSSVPEENSLIEKVLNFDSTDKEIEEFQFELLSQAINKKKWIGWAIDKARKLFPIVPNEETYWPDIEGDVYTLLKNNPSDASLWQEVIKHDPEIVELAKEQNIKYKFLQFSPFENKDNILSRPQYKMYSPDLFCQLQAPQYKTELETFLKEKSVIFDIEGNPDGWAWEYYIHRLFEEKESEFERRIDEDGKYHHITSTEWKPFDNLIRGANIIIGHNIRRHDLKLLSNRENNTLSIDSKTIWDTLEIEVLLNQDRDTYALIVPHKAKEDVQITEKLFYSQLQRILASENAYQRVKDFLPECLKEYLQRQIPSEEKKYISESFKKNLP